VAIGLCSAPKPGDDSGSRTQTMRFMKAPEEDAPTVGTQVEMRRSRSWESEAFERAVVVNRLIDPALGVVLELQFRDATRMQRVWPSSTIRRAK